MGPSTERSRASMSDIVTIAEDDLIESVADALQYISYYHPMDYIRALGEAYEVERGPAAKDAIAQILTNSRMCAEGHRPICQDTGIVNVFVKWGQDCRLESSRSLQEGGAEGVPPAATPATTLRACSRSRWSRAIPSRSTSPPRAAAARTSPSSR